MKYAWIENKRIRDIASSDPFELYHSDIAKFYDTSVPDDASNGDGWVNNKLVKQEVISVQQPEQQPEAVKVSPVEFKLLFTSPERIAIKSARTTDPVIEDFFDIVEDPRLTHVNLGLQSTKDAIGYLSLQGLITSERVLEILTAKIL